MSLLALLPGLALPSLAGWLALDALEDTQGALSKAEKWIYGFLLGMTLMTFIAFVAHAFFGLSFGLPLFLIVHTLIIVPLGLIWWKKSVRAVIPPARRSSPQANEDGSSSWGQWILWALGGWIGLQILALATLLFLMPSFFDDTLDNWNMRAKVFFHTGSIEPTLGSGIGSYPPSVPLSKTWLVSIANTWNEGLANSIHMFWFFAALCIVYCTLRRSLSREWSLLGMLMLAGLPLYLFQGMNAYADVFLSAHLLAGIAPLYLAVKDRMRALPWLRIAAFAIALVPFTKNEGWALYFPVLILLYGIALLHLWRTGIITRKQMVMTGALAAMFWVAVCGPWIGFKIMHGLPFGNAKGIDTDFAWQPGVAMAIWVNTFFEGNWIFLFPLFLGLAITRWKTILTSPLLVLAAFLLIPYGLQLFAFFFTGLAIEAIFQTGYARGVIHLVPVMVLLTTFLLHDLLHRKNGQ